MAICALIMCMSSRSGLARYPAFRHSPPETVHNSHNEPNRTERQSAIPSRLHPRPFWGISLAINLLVTFLRCDITLIHNPSSLIVPALPILCRLSPHLSPFPPDRTCPAARQFPSPDLRLRPFESISVCFCYFPVLELRSRILSTE